MILSHKKCIIVFPAHLSPLRVHRSCPVSVGGGRGGPSGRGRVRPGWGEDWSGNQSEWSAGPRPVTARPAPEHCFSVQMFTNKWQVGPEPCTLAVTPVSVHKRETSLHSVPMLWFKKQLLWKLYEWGSSFRCQNEWKIVQNVPVDIYCIGQITIFLQLVTDKLVGLKYLWELVQN